MNVGSAVEPLVPGLLLWVDTEQKRVCSQWFHLLLHIELMANLLTAAPFLLTAQTDT